MEGGVEEKTKVESQWRGSSVIWARLPYPADELTARFGRMTDYISLLPWITSIVGIDSMSSALSRELLIFQVIGKIRDECL